MNIGKGKILLGECLELMKDILCDSIDMVFTSPPYVERRKGVTMEYHRNIMCNGLHIELKK